MGMRGILGVWQAHRVPVLASDKLAFQFKDNLSFLQLASSLSLY